jgi:hypothetical protein
VGGEEKMLCGGEWGWGMMMMMTRAAWSVGLSFEMCIGSVRGQITKISG